MRACVLIVLLLTACAAPTSPPAPRVSLQGERSYDTFDQTAADWDTFVVPGNLALFRLGGGVLEGAVVGDRGYIWSLNRAFYRNTAIDARIQQTQGSVGNGFGILCRADEAGNGYYFVISSARQFAILRATPDADDPVPLVAWQPHPALRPGFEPNDLSITCVDDYLVFSANGQFLAETRDQTFAGGQVGVALGATNQTAWVSFDNIRVTDAVLDTPR